jgi:hypothetical protein
MQLLRVLEQPSCQTEARYLARTLGNGLMLAGPEGILPPPSDARSIVSEGRLVVILVGRLILGQS